MPRRNLSKNPAGFEDVFHVAETGELSETEFNKYVSSMVTEYDKLVIGEYFHREGYEKGKAEGKAEERESVLAALMTAGASEELISTALKIANKESL